MKATGLKSLSLTVLMLAMACGEKNTATIIRSETELGEKLFFEKALSRDSSVSCGSCHKPQFAFADSIALSPGIFGLKGNRNTPSAMNQVDRNFYFWDGRAETLEEQALGPMENHVEMDFPLTLTIRRLQKDKNYREAFHQIYGKRPSKELVAQAIAAYERTLETSESRFDRYLKEEDTVNFSISEKRGLALFNGKAKCFDCHFGVDFTGGDQFRNIGLYNGQDLNDAGRFIVTNDPKDLGRFKIPGLRNIQMTAPYMHNGMFKTLEEVVEYYNEPNKFVPNAINRDSSLSRPLGLTEQEKKDLVQFMQSLTDDQFLAKTK